MEIDLFFLATIFIAAIIVVIAYKKGKIDKSAVVASAVIGFTTIFLLDEHWKLVYAIFLFFVSGNLISKYKYSEKENRGVAEGVRTFRNVFGNGASATIYVIFYYFTHSPVFLLGFLGSMATASADTFATEVGEAHESEPRLITTLRKTKVGTSGAISLFGYIGSLTGSAIIASISFFVPFVPNVTKVFLIVALSGFVGCNIDSFIGATIERKRIDTHMTNFLGTLLGGFSAMLLYLIL